MLAITCLLRGQYLSVGTGIAGSLVTILDCQLRGAVHLTVDLEIDNDMASNSPSRRREPGGRLDEASEKTADVAEPATPRIISGTPFVSTVGVPFCRAKDEKRQSCYREIGLDSDIHMLQERMHMRAGSYP
jgi:hypothetical protein